MKQNNALISLSIEVNRHERKNQSFFKKIIRYKEQRGDDHYSRAPIRDLFFTCHKK